MDNNQHTPVTDDQELANVLAGMNQQAADPAADDLTVIDPPVAGTAPLSTPELQFEDTPLTPVVSGDAVDNQEPPVADELPAVETPAVDAPAEEVVEPEPEETPAVEPEPTTPVITPTTLTPPSASSDLDDIKKDALEELRPLVDKLDLPADEKFDTLLLIIRSTDDKTLVNAAHEAARAIPDEAKRAQALLDVIKEIDYFSGHGEQPAA